MKRRRNPLSFAKSSKPSASSRFSGSTTVFIRIGSRKSPFAFSRALRTLLRPSTPVIFRNFSLSSVSRLTLRRSSPASTSFSKYLPRRIPLVVMATVETPRIDFSIFTNSGRSRLTKGSPPVRRTFLTPKALIISTNLAISSYRRMSSWCSFETRSPTRQ